MNQPGINKFLKCKFCNARAVHPRLRLCKEHFIRYFDKKVLKVLKHVPNLENQSLLVAVSGGKDSLTAAHVLKRLGLKITLYFLNLGIFDFSLESERVVKAFAKTQCLDLKIDVLKPSLPELLQSLSKKKIFRKPCSVCGLIKRYRINKYAFEQGFSFTVTGHNLDDELSLQILNLATQNFEQAERLNTVLMPKPSLKLAGRVKPLYWLSEFDIALYAKLNNIEVVNSRCVYNKGNKQFLIKRCLNNVEQSIPSFKQGLLKSIRKLLKHKAGELEFDTSNVKPCKRCGYPTTSKDQVCSYCKIFENLD